MGKKSRNKKRLKAYVEQKQVATNATAKDHNFYELETTYAEE